MPPFYYLIGIIKIYKAFIINYPFCQKKVPDAFHIFQLCRRVRALSSNVILFAIFSTKLVINIEKYNF